MFRLSPPAAGSPALRALLRLLAPLLILALLVPAPSPARAAGGGVIFYVEGTTGYYTDRTGTRPLFGAPVFGEAGRAFGARMPRFAPPRDARLGAFPYGVYGLFGTDANGDGDYTDARDLDPVRLMDDIASDGAYNLALSSTLGRLRNEAELVRILSAARDRNLRLVIRATELVQHTGTTVQRESITASEFLNRPDRTGEWAIMADGSGVYTMDGAATTANLRRIRKILTEHPDLEPTVHALYGYDEPMQRNMAIEEMRRIYQTHKSVLPDVPVFVVFNQSRGMPDGNGDGQSDGLLGQPENPYGAGVTDIVGLNVYSAAGPNYDYGAIRTLYAHGRRVVDRYSAATPIWAVPQAHGLITSPENTPEPHALYRQVNDWFRAGPDSGLRGVDGLLWYSWRLPAETGQADSDLEGNPANRRMARAIGARLRSGTAVTHRLPYRRELFVPAAPAAPITAPAAGHLDPAAGTIRFSLSHQWAGDDGHRHVLFDAGEGAGRNRLLVEKTAGNVLRLVVIDAAGAERWTGLPVTTYTMPGIPALPGYNEVVATWDGGALALYLDGVRGTLGGGTGTGVLSGMGRSLYLGTDLAGRNGAEAAYSYLAIEGGALSEAEVVARATDAYPSDGAGRVSPSSPAEGAQVSTLRPTLSWSADARAVRYQVQIAPDAGFGTVTAGSYVTGTTYMSPSLAGARTYYWRVRALDDYGAGAWSAVRSFSTPDVTPPSGSITVAGGATYSRSASVELSVPASDDASGVSAVRMSNSPATSGGVLSMGRTDAYATRIPWSLADPAYGGSATNGARTVYAQWRDAAGNWSAVRSDAVVLDTVAPSAYPPVSSLGAGTRLGTDTVPVVLRWRAGSDATSGIARYLLQQSTDGGRTYTSVPAGTGTSVTRSLQPGATPYAFLVRSRDGAGNWSVRAIAPGFTTRLYQETSTAADGAASYPTGGWRRVALSGSSGGYVRYASAKDSRMLFTFTGRSVAWVSRTGSDRGKAEVSLVAADGTRTRLAVVDLYAATASTRRLVFARSWATSAARTLEVRVLGAKNASSTGTRVDVDAFVVLR